MHILTQLNKENVRIKLDDGENRISRAVLKENLLRLKCQFAKRKRKAYHNHYS